MKPLRYLSREYVEQRAAEVLRRYQQISGRRLDLPLSAELIGSVVFELDWDWEDINEPPNERILAALYAGEGRATLNERHFDLLTSKPGMEHYTRGHEVGHCDLHVDHAALAQQGPAAQGPIFHRDLQHPSARRASDHYWRERQADWYAAALIMPKDLFIPVVRDQNPTDKNDYHDVAKLFDVTFTALNYRMRRLGFAHFDKNGALRQPGDQDADQLSLFA